MADVGQVLEEIQMVSVNIQNNPDLREQLQEAVGVLAGLRQEGLGVTDPHIAADGRQDAAHRDGGIQVSLHQDMGEHRGGGSLAVGAGHGDGGIIIPHQLPEKLGPGKHGNIFGLHSRELRVVRMDGGGVHHHVDIVSNIRGALGIRNDGAQAGEPPGQRGLLRVGAADGKAAL